MRGRSPLFGGATQYGSNATNAYPGQFNFWADVGLPDPTAVSAFVTDNAAPSNACCVHSCQGPMLAPK